MKRKRSQELQSQSNWLMEEKSQPSFKIKKKKSCQNKIKEESYQDSIFLFSNRIEDNSKDQFSEDLIRKLYDAKDHLQKFMSELGPLLERNIPEFILKHIGKKKNPHRTLHFSTVKEYTKQRIEKMIKNKRIKKNWTTEDLAILIWIVAKYCQVNNIKDVYYSIGQEDWERISSMIPSSTAQNCMFKWLSLKKIKKEDLHWKKKEQEILMELTKQKEDKQEDIHWNQIAKKLFYKNSSRNKIYRGGKQCRERWNCFLNPKIKKGLWEKDQDIKLIKMIYEGQGQKKWSRLVPYFGGRTENALKNRYHLLIEKQLRLAVYMQKMTEIELQQKFLERNYIDTFFPSKEKALKQQQISKFIKFEEKEGTYDLKVQSNCESTLSIGTSLLKVIKLNEEQVESLKQKIIENKNDFQACRLLQNGAVCMDYSPQ